MAPPVDNYSYKITDAGTKKGLAAAVIAPTVVVMNVTSPLNINPGATTRWGRLKQLIVYTFKGWSDDKASSWAAALSYYTMLSLGPLLFIAVTVCGLIFGADTSRHAIIEQVQQLLGDKTASTIDTMMQQAHKPGQGWLGTLLGIATLVFGASGVFAALQEAMDAIWHVEPDPQAGVRSLVKRRFLSMTMVLGIGFLLTVSLITSSVLAALGHVLRQALPMGEVLSMGLEFAVSTVVLGLFFATLYKVLPDAEIRWRDVWVGGAVTGLLFNVGKIVIGLYLGHSEVAGPFGAAGSLALVLIWVYYAAQVVFLGAEFTQVFAQLYGRGLQPKPDAVAVKTVQDRRAG